MALRCFFLLISIFLFTSCEEEDFLPKGSQLMLNPNLSAYPDNVFPWSDRTSSFLNGITGVSRDEFVTGNRSLFIENLDTTSVVSSSWSQTYQGPMPPPGSTVGLLVFLKGENIRTSPQSTGGVLTGIRIDISDNAVDRGVFSQNEIMGDFDWYLLTTTFENFPKDAESISVILTMPDLTYGKIYFDEINLIVR
jgi:hypothetical protein